MIKVLWFDGDGLCLFAKRLERGRFVWPQAVNGCVSLSPAQLKLRYLGEDVSEILDYIPGYFQVVRHVRPKFSRACCSHIIQAAAPSRPIDRARYGPGLLAQLLMAKYAYHMPLYPQAQAYLHEGVELQSATMSDAVGNVTKLLTPLVQCLHDYVLALGKLHADNVPVPILSQVAAAARLDGFGSTQRMIAQQGVPGHRQSGLLTHRTGKESIHNATCVTLPAYCKPMPLLAIACCIKVAKSSKLPVWRMPGASSTIYMLCMPRQSQQKPSSASVNFI